MNRRAPGATCRRADGWRVGGAMPPTVQSRSARSQRQRPRWRCRGGVGGRERVRQRPVGRDAIQRARSASRPERRHDRRGRTEPVEIRRALRGAGARRGRPARRSDAPGEAERVARHARRLDGGAVWALAPRARRSARAPTARPPPAADAARTVKRDVEAAAEAVPEQTADRPMAAPSRSAHDSRSGLATSAHHGTPGH